MIDSLTLWLEIIAKNEEGQLLTHWEIQAVFHEFAEFFTSNTYLQLKIYPLLLTIKHRGKSHKHKALIAKFLLRIIEEYKDEKKSDPINLDPLDPDCF